MWKAEEEEKEEEEEVGRGGRARRFAQASAAVFISADLSEMSL